MRDFDPVAYNLGELPEDYRHIYEGMSVSTPRGIRQTPGRYPLAPNKGITNQSPMTRKMYQRKMRFPAPKESNLIDYFLDRLEERLRSVKTVSARPPWIDPPAPPYILPIDSWTDDVVVASANSLTTVLSFDVPDFHHCRIAKFGQWVESDALASSLEWSIAINNNPQVPGIGIDGVGRSYDAFSTIIGTITNPGDVFFIAPQNSTVSVLVNNTSATDDIEVKTRLVGWAFRFKFDTDAASTWSTGM